MFKFRFLKSLFGKDKKVESKKTQRKRGHNFRMRRKISREVKNILDSVDMDKWSGMTKEIPVLRWPGKQAKKVLLDKHGILVSCGKTLFDAAEGRTVVKLATVTKLK